MSLNRIITSIVLLFSLLVKANDFSLQVDSAKVAYEKGDYPKAIRVYEAIINANVESPYLYYNTGNAYFKNNEIGMAILYYEKAKKLNPDDEDLLTNLKIANQRIEDKIDEAPEFFFAQWQNSIADLMNEKQWSYFLIALFTLSLLLIAIYLISSHRIIRQICFFTGIVLILVSISTYFIAAKKHNKTVNSYEAVIISPSANANGSPSEKGTKLFILHEGTKVKITEESGDWTEIRIANGNVGWVKSAALKKI